MKTTKIPGLGNYGVFIDGVNFEQLTEIENFKLPTAHSNNA